MNMAEVLLDEGLQGLESDYASKLPSHIGHIEDLWFKLGQVEWNPVAFGVFRRLVDALATSAGSSGFASLAHAARRLEAMCGPIMESRAAPAPEKQQQISALIGALDEQVAAIDVVRVVWANVERADGSWRRLGDPGSDVDDFAALRAYCIEITQAADLLGLARVKAEADALNALCLCAGRAGELPTTDQARQIGSAIENLKKQVASAASSLLGEVDDSDDPSVARVQADVFVMDVDPDACQALCSTVELLGFPAQAFASPRALLAALEHRTPAVVLLGLSAAETDEGLISKLDSLKTAHEGSPHLIYIAPGNDVHARLQAVRAGGDAYIPDPIDPAALSAMLEEYTSGADAEPYRILIIDDNAEQAALSDRILSRAGMVTRTVMDPLQFMEPMAEFQPDLILLDLYMPECNGFELAKMIRQHGDFVAVPIVFLSSETDRTVQSAAMSLGGDDFLTKPVDPRTLASAVSNRVRRARSVSHRISHLSEKDPVTGIYNRQYFEAALRQAIAAADRRSGAVLQVELDNFTDIRDQMQGDADAPVIGTVVGLLRQGLPAGDLVARLSDNTLGVLTSMEDPRQVLELAHSLQQTLGHDALNVGGRALVMSASIGIVTIDETVTDAHGAMHEAALAVEVVRAAGGGGVHLHDAVADADIGQEVYNQCTQLIVKALNEDGFGTVYKPVIDLGGTAGTRYVLMGRLDDENGDEILPSTYLPVAEKVGLAVDIDRAIIERAFGLLKSTVGDLQLFVGVSGKSLLDGQFRTWLDGRLAECDIPHGRLFFELDQAAAVRYLGQAGEFSELLQRHGCGLGIVHFSAETDNGKLFDRLAVDYVKIDGSHLRGLGTSEDNQRAVRAIAELARAKGVFSIAEFAEDAMSMAVLWQVGVTFIEGDFVPAPESQLIHEFSYQHD